MMEAASKNELRAYRDWAVAYLAKLLGMDPSHVDLAKGLNEYGLDSVDAMIMAGEFEEHFGVEIDPAVVFEADTVQKMLEAWEKIDGSK